MEVSSKVFALGNSNAIRIPRILMEIMELHAEDPITMEVTGKNELIIRKQTPTAYPSIRELMAGYTGVTPEEPGGGIVGRELI